MASERTCPFCQILLPNDPQMWGKVGDFKVGRIASCEVCFAYARQAKKATEAM